MRRYVMIGAPVTSVRTPPLLAARLAELGAPARVDAVHVEPAELAAFLRGVREDPAIDGLLVTMPHKRATCDHLDALGDAARAAGAVNAVKRLDGRLVGAQFDGIALRSALLEAGADLASARVLVAGLGGAGLAIALALVGRCRALLVSEADPARLAAVLPTLPDAVALAPGHEPVADILVNATPLGMKDDDPSPFPDAWVERARLIADIVADPKATRLAAAARGVGTPLVTGRRMVAHQVEPIARWLLSDSAEHPG